MLERFADYLRSWEMPAEAKARLWFRRKEIFYVVERMPPIGWCVLSDHESYVDAYYTRKALEDNAHTRVMTKSEWERQTLIVMASRAPWRALSTMAHDMQKLKSELADLRAIQNTGVMALYADPRAAENVVPPWKTGSHERR